MNNLNELAGHLTGRFQSAAVTNQNFFVNDIPANLPISYNKEWLSSVISAMLSVVVRHAHNTRIRLSARRYGYIIVLEMEQDGDIDNYARDRSLQQIEQLANRIGGCIHMSYRESEMKILSFSFPNLPLIA